MKFVNCKMLQHKRQEFLELRRHSAKITEALPPIFGMFSSFLLHVLLPFTTIGHLFGLLWRTVPSLGQQLLIIFEHTCPSWSYSLARGALLAGLLSFSPFETFFGHGHNINSTGQPCCWLLTLGTAPRTGLCLNPACPATARWGCAPDHREQTQWETVPRYN